MTATESHGDQPHRVVRGSRRDADGTCHLELAGELDLLTAEDFGAAVATVMTGGPTTIVVDATAVTFIDSTGIGTLLAARRDCRESGGVFSVLQSTSVEKVTRLLGVHDVLVGVSDDPDGTATA